MSMFPTGDDDWAREVRKDSARVVVGLVLACLPWVLLLVGLLSVAIDAVT